MRSLVPPHPCGLLGVPLGAGPGLGPWEMGTVGQLARVRDKILPPRPGKSGREPLAQEVNLPPFTAEMGRRRTQLLLGTTRFRTIWSCHLCWVPVPRSTARESQLFILP